MISSSQGQDHDPMLSFDQIKKLVEDNQVDKLYDAKDSLVKINDDELMQLIDIAFDKQYWEIADLLQKRSGDGIGRKFTKILNSNFTDWLRYRLCVVKDEKSGHLLLKKEYTILDFGEKHRTNSHYIVPLISFCRTDNHTTYDLFFPFAKCTLLSKRNLEEIGILQMLYWILQMCVSVQSLHQQGKVHGHVSLQNFHCYDHTNRELIKLFYSEMPLEMNEEGEEFGIIGYLAPEVYNEEVPIHTKQADIFSLGVAIINLFCKNDKQYLYDYAQPKYLKDIAAPVIDNVMKDGCPLVQYFSSLILSMIEEKPENRPTMEQVINTVQDVIVYFTKAGLKLYPNVGFCDCSFEFQNSSDTFEKGCAHYLQGNFRSAIYNFKSLLEIHRMNSTGLKTILAQSFLNVGEFSEYISMVDAMLEQDPHCKSAYVHKILYLCCCGKLNEALEEYTIMKHIKEFSDVDFEGFICDFNILKNFINHETKFVIPEWDDDIYIIVHYKSRLCIAYLTEITDMDDLIGICKRKFSNNSLKLIFEYESTHHIQNIDQLVPKKHYFILERKHISNNAVVGDIVLDFSYYENKADTSQMIKFIRDHDGFSVYQQLVDHRYQGLIKIFDTSTLVHNEEVKSYVLLEKCKQKLSTFLENDHACIKQLCNMLKHICKCTQELHSEEIVHLNMNLDSFLINCSERIVLGNLDNSCTVEELDEMRGGPDEDEIVFDIRSSSRQYSNPPEYYYFKLGKVGKIISNVYSLDCWGIGIIILLYLQKYLLDKKKQCPEELLQLNNQLFGEFAADKNSHKEIHDFVHNIIDQLFENEKVSLLLKDMICGLLDKDPSNRTTIKRLIEQIDELIFQTWKENTNTINLSSNEWYNYVHELVSNNRYHELSNIGISQFDNNLKQDLVDIAFKHQNWEVVCLFQSVSEYGLNRDYKESDGYPSGIYCDTKTGHQVLFAQFGSSLKAWKHWSAWEYTYKLEPCEYFVPIIDRVYSEESLEIIVPAPKYIFVDYELAKIAINEPMVMKWILQMCKAVLHLHHLGFLCTTLELESFFLYDNDLVKLSQTWAACKMNSEIDFCSYNGMGVSLAPELRRKVRVTHTKASNIFSLGTAIAMLLCTIYTPEDCLQCYLDSTFFLEKTRTLFQRLQTIHNEKLCNLILSMIDNNPRNRPSLENCINCIQDLIQLMRKTGIAIPNALYDCILITNTNPQLK